MSQRLHASADAGAAGAAACLKRTSKEKVRAAIKARLTARYADRKKD